MTGVLLIKLIILILSQNPNDTGYITGNRQDCTECHSDITDKNFLHPDVSSSCDICHSATGEPHPGDGNTGFVLSENVPELCFLCHSDMFDESVSSRVAHGMVSGPFNCISCHNPHSSNNARLLKRDGNDLCLSCHNKTIRTDSSEIKNIKILLSGNNIIHQAIEGGCVTCHDPHFSANARLLTGSFPEGQYVKAAAEEFEICFMCHDEALFNEESTEYGTGFREGSKNLHYLHVNREKGRNCNMCHDVHGAAYEHLLVDKLQFGEWEMIIKYISEPDGGSCLTACHSEKHYRRSTN